MAEQVSGVDGCPGGWIAVLWRGPGWPADSALCPSFADVLALDAAIIAVDMPIGLPDRAPREVERAVRPLLGKRRASVFAVPARPALAAMDYLQACAINRGHSEPPRAVSRQCFHLFEKIREIDAIMTPELQSRVYEAHPEVAFRLMKGEPLAFRKRSSQGQDERRALLRGQGLPIERLLARRYRGADARGDDLIDAAALAWVALRIRNRANRRFPASPSQDGRGLRMEINA
jgi:predicted RNase H-like nuclease